MSAPPRLFCFGLGFSGQTLGHRLMRQGWQVAGTVRTREKAEQLNKAGFQAFCFDRDQPLDPEALESLYGATKVLSSVPTDAQGDALYQLHAETLASHPNCDWFGYLSTTVVYGDWQGAWVDETSQAKATSVRGLRRLEAEADWTRLGLPLHIFRLAGIYGPNRNALKSLQVGKSRIIDKPDQVFSRIHVIDIAGMLEASIKAPTATPDQPDIFNGCDAEPCAPGDVIRHAANLMGIPAPAPIAFEHAELSAMGRSFYEDNKRVSSAKLKRVLNYDLAYPSYREGLAHEWRLMQADTQHPTPPPKKA